MRLAPDHPLQIVLGLTLWFAWFVAVYGGLSVGCAIAGPEPGRGWTVGLGVALALSALAFIACFCGAAVACWRAARTHRPETSERADRRFIAMSAAVLHAVSAVATGFVALTFIALPLVPLSPCR